MQDVAKDIDSDYRPDGEPKKPTNTGTNTGAPIPQAHGGAIHAPGNPGNKGGPGRPPSEIRSACREHGYTQIENLGRLAEDLKAGKIEMSVTEQTRLSEALNKYGVGTSIAYTLDEEEAVNHCVAVAQEQFGVDPVKFAHAIIEALK